MATEMTRQGGIEIGRNGRYANTIRELVTLIDRLEKVVESVSPSPDDRWAQQPLKEAAALMREVRNQAIAHDFDQLRKDA